MAYAGTPTGLAQQAGTSRPWKTLVAAIAVLAIGLALVIAVMLVNSRAVAPAADRGFDQIEAQRGAAVLSAGTTFVSEDKPAIGTSPAAFLNAAAANARAMSGVVNTTSTAVEKAAAARARAMSGVPAVGTRLDATSVDRKYHEIQSRGASQIDQSRGAHGPLK
jgi:hypothetical protein